MSLNSLVFPARTLLEEGLERPAALGNEVEFTAVTRVAEGGCPGCVVRGVVRGVWRGGVRDGRR